MSYAVCGLGEDAFDPVNLWSSILPAGPQPVQHLLAPTPSAPPESGDAEPATVDEPAPASTPSVHRTASLSRSLTLVAVQPAPLGLYAGWAAVALLGGFGLSLIWRATHA